MPDTLRPIRRATLDDLPQLMEMWRLDQLPLLELEKRFKEFQVAELEDGTLLGALGIQVSGHEARLHSETFKEFDRADELRALIWKRIQTMAENQGWVRIWTQLTAPPWRTLGFDPATNEQLGRLPDVFGKDRGLWQVIQLKEERASLPSVDAELQMLRLAHEAEREEMLKKARTLKWIAGMIALVLLGMMVWAASVYFKARQNRPGVIQGGTRFH